MLRYFTSRELALKFKINLARWKRWSRVFLPPDPLGGLQSGYARQYSIDQTFCVYLGGILVSELRFSIPEAQLILRDLTPWLGAAGIYLNEKADRDLIDRQLKLIQDCLIFIRLANSHNAGQIIEYAIHGELSGQASDHDADTLKIRKTVTFSISGLPAIPVDAPWLHLRVLNISNILSEFVSALGIDRGLYPIELFSKK